MENINLTCKFCGKSCKNYNSLRNHERLCKSNPCKQESNFTKYNANGHKGHKGHNQYTKAKDLGLPKPEWTLERRLNQSKRMRENNPSKKEEVRKKISESVKKWCLEHPNEVPYRKYHSSKESYPEKYFREVLENANVQFEQEYSVHRYSLDFAFPEKKVYFEVDGKQHECMTEHDEIRTKFLAENGWRLLRRIEWWKYKKLNSKEQEEYCKDLIKDIVK